MPSFTNGLVLLSALTVAANAANLSPDDGETAKRLVRKSLSEVSATASSGKSREAAKTGMLGPKVQGLLEEVEAMVKSKEVPDSAKQSEIMDIVKTELIPGLENERDYAKGEVASALAAFDACNTRSGEGQEKMKQFGATTVNDDRQEHGKCRGREETNHQTRMGRCGELDTFLETVQVPSEIPAGRNRRAMVQYTKEMTQYFCPMEPSTEQMAEACKKAIDAHKSETEKCNTAQATFELAFCTWRQKLIDTCAEADNCYKAASDNYALVKTATDKLVTKLKTEYSALEKIKCYLGVWLNEQEKPSQDAYDKCNGAAVDASAMNVEMKGAPAQMLCPLTSVEIHPGTSNFAKQEYDQFEGYAVAPIPCVIGA